MGSDWLERYRIKQLPRSRKRKRKRKLRSLFDIPYDTTERCDTYEKGLIEAGDYTINIDW